MTASKKNVYSFGARFCKISLYLIGLALIVQALDNFFYTRPYDRLFSLGMTFVLIFMLGQALRAMARQPIRRSGYPAPTYSGAMAPVRVRR